MAIGLVPQLGFAKSTGTTPGRNFGPALPGVPQPRFERPFGWPPEIARPAPLPPTTAPPRGLTPGDIRTDDVFNLPPIFPRDRRPFAPPGPLDTAPTSAPPLGPRRLTPADVATDQGAFKPQPPPTPLYGGGGGGGGGFYGGGGGGQAPSLGQSLYDQNQEMMRRRMMQPRPSLNLPDLQALFPNVMPPMQTPTPPMRPPAPPWQPPGGSYPGPGGDSYAPPPPGGGGGGAGPPPPPGGGGGGGYRPPGRPGGRPQGGSAFDAKPPSFKGAFETQAKPRYGMPFGPPPRLMSRPVRLKK